VTELQNRWNRRNSARKGKYRGVRFDARSGMYNAQISVNGRKVWIGSYKSEVQAALAFDKSVKAHRGAFGVLNFPTGGEG
jgi:hypothetical protein